MPVIDTVKDLAGKWLPQKRRPGIPMPISTSSGGIGSGMASYDDEMPLSKPAIVFYALQIFCSFLAMCCFASCASFQAKWKVGPSFLSVYAVFVAVSGMFLSAFMLLVPVISDKYSKLDKLCRVIREERISFILSASGLGWLLFISFITFVSAFTQAGCKDASKDPHASLGKGFQAELPGFCGTKKAGSIFFWFATIAWAATFYVAVKEWREGKVRGRRARDPPFTAPVEHSQEESDGSSYYPAERAVRGGPRPLSEVHEEDEPQSPFADQHQAAYGGMHALSGPPPSMPAPRQSMDTYGAFSDPVPTGYDPPQVSRTMQYADPYGAARAADPYARVRETIGRPIDPSFPPPPNYSSR